MSSQADAVREFTQEDWILFSIGLAVTILRTFSRIKQVGFKGLQADDYLVWFAMVSLTSNRSQLRCTPTQRASRPLAYPSKHRR